MEQEGKIIILSSATRLVVKGRTKPTKVIMFRFCVNEGCSFHTLKLTIGDRI
jgi:hypothetical protein